MSKTKIIIAGIGGAGGYFGGLLARHYYGSDAVEICFLARGENLKQIREHGLRVRSSKEDIVGRPASVSDNASELGYADCIIICTKTYDLEEVVRQLRPCIDHETIILPLLNGVDSVARIKKIIPDNVVLDGCAYIVSRLRQPGLIENIGNIQKLYFGLNRIGHTLQEPVERDGLNKRLISLEQILQAANVEATFVPEILPIIWSKFIFISATATATTYFDCSFGELLEAHKRLETLQSLLEEVHQLALAKGIAVPNHVKESVLTRSRALPMETTSSMHSDFLSGNAKTELESLTGFVCREGKKLGLETPGYDEIYEALLSRS